VRGAPTSSAIRERNRVGAMAADSSSGVVGRYALFLEGQYDHTRVEENRSQPYSPWASPLTP